MKVKDLIKKLSELDQEQNICLHDWRKSLNENWGEGSSVGIYHDFDIVQMFLEDDEVEFIYETEGRKVEKQWVSLIFDNEDYDEDGYEQSELGGAVATE